MQYFDESWFHGIFAKKSWKQNSEFPQRNTVSHCDHFTEKVHDLLQQRRVELQFYILLCTRIFCLLAPRKADKSKNDLSKSWFFHVFLQFSSLQIFMILDANIILRLISFSIQTILPHEKRDSQEWLKINFDSKEGYFQLV